MAVTSDQLLAFIERASTTELQLDANGDEIRRVEPQLVGNALSNALRVVADLAVHESGIAFAQLQFETAYPSAGGNVIPFPGPRAN